MSTTPPRGGTTIARVWKGAVRKQDGDAYARYMQQTGVAGYAKTPGNRGVWMLRRNVDDRTEFMMFALGLAGGGGLRGSAQRLREYP